MEALLGWTTLVSKTAGTFAARTSSDKEHLVVSLTDLVNLWHEDLNTEQILKRCKDLNPSLEMPTDKLISFLCELLHTTNSEDIKIDASNELRVELVIKKKRNEYPFNWHFHLEKQTPRQFLEIITRPLLAVVREASSLEADFCSMLRNKDKQIADYKASGAALSRRNLETPDFNKDKFFAERRLKTIDESVKGDVVNLFCETSTSNSLYSSVAQKLMPKPKTSLANVAEPGAAVAETTPKKAPAKETEESRNQSLQKRLDEEQVKLDAKRAKKNRPKLLL